MAYLENEFNLAHIELFAKLEKQAAAASSIPPEIEIDSINDADFGSLYRVWLGMKLLGTFYKRLDGFWISQPFHTSSRKVWATDSEAITAIAI